MSPPIRGRLFGPGAPPTGTPAELHSFGDEIEVRAGEIFTRARLADIRVREAGFGKQVGFELAWDDPEGTRAVHVLDAPAVQQLKAWPAFAASNQMKAVQSKTRRDARRRSIGWSILVAFLALPILLILGFLWQADRIAGALIERIPIEQEIALGQQAFEDLRASLTLRDSGAAHDAVVTLGERLSQGSKYPYQFHVAEDAAINAFALPGGIIVVHSGLIAATSRPEELAGVLAHEIQHVEQRHSLRGVVKQLGLRGLWALATGDVGSTIIGQATLQMTSLRFSREDESSADLKGFDNLVQHAIDPRGMVDFFATMDAKTAVKPPPFLSTHPADRDRREALNERLSAIGARTYPPLDMGAWPPSLHQ